MIHMKMLLKVNNFDLTTYLSPNKFTGDCSGHGYSTATKRAILISAFEHMPENVVEEIWERAMVPPPKLELLPAQEQPGNEDDLKQKKE